MTIPYQPDDLVVLRSHSSMKPGTVVATALRDDGACTHIWVVFDGRTHVCQVRDLQYAYDCNHSGCRLDASVARDCRSSRRPLAPLPTNY